MEGTRQRRYSFGRPSCTAISRNRWSATVVSARLSFAGEKCPQQVATSQELLPTLAAVHEWGPSPFGNVSQLCASACVGGDWGHVRIRAVFWCDESLERGEPRAI
jgi:hypothetical protein